MRAFVEELRAAAKLDVVVLLRGETGVGKEVAARAIHAWSGRRSRPMVSVNCGGLTESLLESELFGHSRGAFTGALTPRSGVFEASNSGTLFLDEVGELSERAQSSLLRVLQEGTFQRLGESVGRATDFRLIAATHRDLERACSEGAFRLDLFFRLSVVPLRIPPLRHRLEDLPSLSRTLVERHARRLRMRAPKVPESVIRRLQEYDWPGNVRELENALVRALVSSGGSSELREDDLRLHPSTRWAAGGRRERSQSTLAEAQRHFERSYLLDVLARYDGNRSRAARVLGLSRQGLYQKLRRHGILPRNRKPA